MGIFASMCVCLHMCAYRYTRICMYIDISKYACVFVCAYTFCISCKSCRKKKVQCKYCTYLDIQEIMCMTSSYSVIDFVATPATLSPKTYRTVLASYKIKKDFILKKSLEARKQKIKNKTFFNQNSKI